MSEPTDERYTPDYVLDVVRAMFFGEPWLDPCTTPDNRTEADFYSHVGPRSGTYTAETGEWTNPCEGLQTRWHLFAPQVFFNPPYSRGQLIQWVEKCLLERSRAGSGERAIEAIALLPSDLGSKAGQLVAETADGLCFVRGRIAFGSPTGQLEQGAKQPSVMPYWGERAGRFKRIFSQLGTVWVR